MPASSIHGRRIQHCSSTNRPRAAAAAPISDEMCLFEFESFILTLVHSIRMYVCMYMCTNVHFPNYVSMMNLKINLQSRERNTKKFYFVPSPII